MSRFPRLPHTQVVSLDRVKGRLRGDLVGSADEIRANERGHGTLRNGFLKSEKMGSMGRAL